MASPDTETGAPPDWFAEAVATGPETGRLRVDGADIAFLTWGAPGTPAVVLVHGGAAHARWWSPLAPLLATRRRVVALDLSGHGHSDRRPAYTIEHWVEEILAVADATSTGPATVVGHSLGGIVTANAVTTRGAGLAAAVLVDAPVWPSAPMPEHELRVRVSAPARVYPTRHAAMARFRLIPFQRSNCAWYERHVAGHSVRAVPDGWSWCFDPAIFTATGGRGGIARFDGPLAESQCPVSLVLGEKSYLSADCPPPDFGTAEIPVVPIPDAGHHVMLDQPLALVTALRCLLPQTL
jgi:pimeloyl-ACP methyl ester carboxylesterase